MSGKNVDNFLDTTVYGNWKTEPSTPDGYGRNVEIKEEPNFSFQKEI